jgi:outer membrane protein TolC
MGIKSISKNTINLLKVFYSRPGHEFYIQELGRILKKKPGVFQRVLYNLEKDGLLKSYYKANARFFTLNKNYLLYSEFKSIVEKLSKLAVIILALALPLLVARSGSCEEKKQGPLILSSLRETVQLAYKNNKDVQIQELGLKVAGADILGARSAFIPKLNVDAGYTHNGAVLVSGGTPDKKKDAGIFSGFNNDNSLAVSVTDNLYNGGANIAALREAQIGLREQVETLRATKLNVEFDAKRLYYGLLLAYETKRIAEDLVTQAKEHYENVSGQYDQGTASKFDALQSKVQVSLLIPQLISAQNAIDMIMAEMDKLIGLKVGEDVIIKDKLAYLPIIIKEGDFLQEAYLNEPEMILRGLGIDMKKWAIKYARAGWLPQVDFGTQLSYNTGNLKDIFQNRFQNWNIGFTVSMPIFDGFATKAKVDAARAQYLQSKVEKENYADQVAVDMRKACLDLKEAFEVIKSQQDNLEDAKEALKISYVRYNNGVGVNLDVLDAQVALARVEKNLAEGIYDYLMAEARVNRLMGRSLLEEKSEKDQLK